MRPLGVIEPPGRRRPSRGSSREHEARAGARGPAGLARRRGGPAGRGGARVSRPAGRAGETSRWRPTTSASRPGWPRRSARGGAGASEDSLAAAHLLEGYLARREGRLTVSDPTGGIPFADDEAARERERRRAEREARRRERLGERVAEQVPRAEPRGADRSASRPRRRDRRGAARRPLRDAARRRRRGPCARRRLPPLIALVGTRRSACFVLVDGRSNGSATATTPRSPPPKPRKTIRADDPRGLQPPRDRAGREGGGAARATTCRRRESFKGFDPRKYGAEDAESLEGFLFPATYELLKDATAQDLVAASSTAFGTTSRRSTSPTRAART